MLPCGLFLRLSRSLPMPSAASRGPRVTNMGTNAKSAALWLCLGAGFITLPDQSVFVLAVPAMSASLQADSGAVQWIHSSYSLAFGVALVPAGRLGGIVGRRTLFIAGIAVFGASSLLGGLATDPSWVIVARLLQGLGAGTLDPRSLVCCRTFTRATTAPKRWAPTPPRVVWQRCVAR